MLERLYCRALGWSGGESMFSAVFHQGIATVIVAALSWFWLEQRGAISAALGGAVIVVPNLLFALKLWLAERSGQASVAGFFVGEFFKVAATIALLIIVAGAYRDLHWLALLAGMFVALKANLFVILTKA